MTSHTTSPWYVITGATQGVGRAVTFALLAQGASVVAVARQKSTLNELAEACGQRGLPEPYLCSCDLRHLTAEQAQQQVTAVAALTPQVHGLIHCAGNPTSLVPLTYYPEQQWQDVLHLHLTAPFLLTQAFWPLLKAAPQATVVFATHPACQEAPAHWGAYGVCQAGLQQLIHTWSQEVAHTSIRIKEWALPPVATAWRKRLYPGIAEQHWQPVEAVLPELLHVLGEPGLFLT